MSGAVDLDKCPYLRNHCKCGYCTVCGFPKHTAIHGAFYGEAPGSEPFGHEFVLRTKEEFLKIIIKNEVTK